MKKLLTLEELAQFAIAIYGITMLQVPFNTFILVLIFFSPDVFMLGYLVNSKVGGMLYNFSHHKLTAIAMISYGMVIGQTSITVIGLLFYAHSSFDRILGYGLKYLDSFSHTHLGYIGKEKLKNEAQS